jgi:hypothetical protein
MELLKALRTQITEASKVSFVLFRIMVPVIIAVKVLGELGLVVYIARAFEPVMGLVGLPGDMGIVWATSMITNMYGGIVVFASMAPQLHLTTAQITVIACMILVAHSMPVEIAIARRAGIRVRFMVPFRMLSAITLGFILNQVYRLGGFLQGRGEILWEASSDGHDGLGGWALSQLRNLVVIFLIVLALIILMKLLDRSGFTAMMNRALRPVLSSLGIGVSASTVTILGMVLGISYGGGLIIRAVSSGKVPPRDVFFSMSLMGLSHSIVEDSLLMMSLGASITGVLAARLAFTWPVIALLVLAVKTMPDRLFYRWLFIPRPPEQASCPPGTTAP